MRNDYRKQDLQSEIYGDVTYSSEYYKSVLKQSERIFPETYRQIDTHVAI